MVYLKTAALIFALNVAGAPAWADVFGSKGGLAWRQEHPNQLIFTPSNGQAQVLSRGGFKTSASADAATRVPAGHPEGYLEAFVNLYSDIANALQTPDQSVLVPTVMDGARGGRLHVCSARVRSSREPFRQAGRGLRPSV